LTFTTIPGAGATDATSFVGTDGVDILVTFNTLTAFVGAQGSSDRITAGNISGQVDWQVKGGAGNDSIFFQTDMIGGRLNGNSGSDSIDLGDVVADAAVFGGQNDDTIDVRNIANSRINGNLGADRIDGGDVLQSSVFGGQQNDTITLTGDFQSSVIGGNLGDDSITLSGNETRSVFDTTVNGGEGADVINAQALLGVGAGLTIDGGAGQDTIYGSQRDDVISGGANDGFEQIWGEGGADTMTGNAGQAIFGYGLTATDTVDQAAAESFTGKVSDPTKTDVITDWKRDSAVTAGNSGDAILVRGIAANALEEGTGAGYVFTSLKDAMAGDSAAANSIKLVAVGSAGAGYSAYALIYGAATTAAAGAIQLGGAGVYNDVNFVDVITADQIANGIL
jgi:Ca2+-binding RTX toxin-like protein